MTNSSPTRWKRTATSWRRTRRSTSVTPTSSSSGTCPDLWAPRDFNRWALLHENMMVCTSAIRRRVFEAGFWYDEQMRQGYRGLGVLHPGLRPGPVPGRPAARAVFGYRQWGFSINEMAKANHQALMDQMRAAAHGQRSLEPAGGAAAAQAESADASAGGRPIGLGSRHL